jgi:predicted ribosomally synthesized peptide with SipW-like signal peptide
MMKERSEKEKMKSIFLSVVIICALAISGIGGTLATWSDSETSMSNVITTGSVDLKVNGEDDVGPTPDNPLWGNGVPSKVNIECMVPCKMYGGYEVELWNAGICEFPSACFIHMKDFCCSNAPPKVDDAGDSTGYQCPETGDLKPEPELVAEFGGKVDCRYVDGIGEAVGDTCSMKSHVYCWVVADDPDYEPVYDDTSGKVMFEGKLIDFECMELYLFDLMPCEPRTIYLWFHLQQESEEDYGFDYFADPGDPGFDELEWIKFNDWPSWSLMRDRVTFSMEFDLLLMDP